MVATDVSALSPINDVIHDRFFYLAPIKLEGSTVVIRVLEDDRSALPWFWPFGQLSKIRRIAVGTLVFHEVEELSVIDTVHVGSYPIHHVSYDPSGRLLTVHTNIPLSLRMKVRDLHVSFEPEEGGAGSS